MGAQNIVQPSLIVTAVALPASGTLRQYMLNKAKDRFEFATFLHIHRIFFHR